MKYEPGARVEPHYHHCDYASIVVEGSIEVTRRNHEVGSIRVVDAGTGLRPVARGSRGLHGDRGLRHGRSRPVGHREEHVHLNALTET